MKVTMNHDNMKTFSIHFDELSCKEFDDLRCLFIDVGKRAEVLNNFSVYEGLSLEHIVKGFK